MCRAGPAAPATGEIWGHTFNRQQAQGIQEQEGPKAINSLKRKILTGGLGPVCQVGDINGGRKQVLVGQVKVLQEERGEL